jgi:hypothetical protein
MNLAVEVSSSCDNLEDLFIELDSYCRVANRKVSRNAIILGRLEQIEVENN